MDTPQKAIWVACASLFLVVAFAIRAYVRSDSLGLLSSVEREYIEMQERGEPTTTGPTRPPPGGFLPLPKPGPVDWLAMHDEPGQTFEQFLRSERNPVDSGHRTIYLLPLDEFGGTGDPSPEWLRRFAETYFCLPAILLPVMPDTQKYFENRLNPYTGNRQLHAGDILEHLMEHVPEDAYCLIAITMVDLYPDDAWNFVFGYATYSERVGVFSFARYHPRFYGKPADSASANLALYRSAKILAHETGHMFGMAHCIAHLCCMNGCNHLAEADRQPLQLCPVCRRKLTHAIGFDPTERYRELEGLYREAGWEEDVRWVMAAGDGMSQSVKEPK